MWTRDSTKEWIAQVELRLEDINYYIERTVDWCGNNGVYSERLTFICLVLTVVWVAYMRQESVTKHEIFEILGVSDLTLIDDEILELGKIYRNMDHSEMLEEILSNHLY